MVHKGFMLIFFHVRPGNGLQQFCFIHVSMSITARILKVGSTMVQRWVKVFARDFIVSASPEDAVVVEIDEMWHYLKKVQQTLDLESL